LDPAVEARGPYEEEIGLQLTPLAREYLLQIQFFGDDAG
jgi:hypothetical protein